jgi:hypothetical protein
MLSILATGAAALRQHLALVIALMYRRAGQPPKGWRDAERYGFRARGSAA